MTTSLKNRLRILSNYFAIILAEETGASPSSERDGRIYRLAVHVLKKTLNLVISRRSRAWTAKKCTKRRDARAKLLVC